MSFECLVVPVEAWKNNPCFLAEMNEKLQHLTVAKEADVVSFIVKHPDLVRNGPGRSTKVVHDIVVGEATLIKTGPVPDSSGPAHCSLKRAADIVRPRFD